MNTFKQYSRVLQTFLLSFVILTIGLSIAKIYPFGTRQIMIIDSWHQYYPILQQLHDKLIHGKSLFYTWQSGAGTNFWLMMGYYAMSPFNLLSLLVKPDYLREFMAFATVFKIAMGGAFFSYYLQKTYHKTDFSVMIFGMLYAFCGFFMGYYWNLMWLDIAALLPLLTLGLHALINQRRFVLFTAVFSYILISNFYMAYFICMYIALYTFVYIIAESRPFSFVTMLKDASRVVLFSVLSFAIAMVVLLPVFYGMQMAYGLSSNDPKAFKAYYTLIDLFNRLLALTKPAVIDGLPNINIGIFGLVFTLLYFALPNERTRAKIAYGGFLALLLISFNINYLNFVWHGFHFPNQVPYRFAFIFSFIALNIAYRAYLHLPKLSASTIRNTFIGLVIYVIFIEKLITENDFSHIVYSSLVLLILYYGLLQLDIKAIVSRQFAIKLLSVVILIEIVTGTAVAFIEAGNSERTTYPDKAQQVSALLAQMRAKDDNLYRVEMYPLYTSNDPLLYHYNGVTQFSSTANSKYNSFTKILGLSSNEPSNSYKYYPNTPIANGFLGIRYMLSKNEKLAMPNAAYQLVGQQGEVSLLKNQYALPFAFGVDNQIYNFKGIDYSPFIRQEELINLATNQQLKPFISLKSSEENFGNMEIQDHSHIRYRYRNIDSNKSGHVEVSFTVEQAGQHYVYLKDQAKTATLSVKSVTTTYDPRRGVVMDLGILEVGDSFMISLDTKAAERGFFDLQAVLFKPIAFQGYLDVINQAAFIIEDYDDTTVTGSITMTNAGLLYTSIPYEKGWRALVDGQVVTPVAFDDAVLTIPLSAGKHKVKLSYRPYGFKRGAIISLVGLVIFIALIIITKRRKTVHSAVQMASLDKSVNQDDQANTTEQPDKVIATINPTDQTTIDKPEDNSNEPSN